MATYMSIDAGPSVYPARRYCSICGFEAAYTCAKCGAWECSRECVTLHNETRCMKWVI